MIFVNELDNYLRSFYYWINFDFYSEIFGTTNELKAWKSFFDNQSAFLEIEKSADDFGFIHECGAAKAMAGAKEILTRRMNYYLSFDGLRIYPRLLYSEGYIPKPDDFEMHRYYFTYIPKILGPLFVKKEDGSLKPILRQFTTTGSHRRENTGEQRIAYNVSVSINLETIVEEELHSLGGEVHGTTKREDVLKAIRTKDPKLEKEIELNLNSILSAEEKRFRDFGGLIAKEKCSEIRLMETFSNLFENTLIQTIK